jgi:hypothetical protein
MNIGLDANWVTAIATLVLAVLNFFYLRSINRQLNQIEEQNKIIKQQYETQVESFLRNNTINTLSTWLKTFERKAILARHILGELKEEDVKNIYKFFGFSINNYDEKKGIKYWPLFGL